VGASEVVVGSADAHGCATAYVSLNAHVGIHVSDALSVALRHRDDFGTDFDGLTATLLRGAAATLADRERDLIARAPRVPVALEGMATKQQDGCVLVDGLPRVPADLRHGFAKRREVFTRELEADHVLLETRIRNVVGEASRTMAADELLDFADGPAASGFKPLLLSGWQRDARELARVREADGASLQVSGGLGQLFERNGYSELFLREMRTVAEESLRVFVERGEPEPNVHAGALSVKKRDPFLEIEPRPLGGQTDELFVRLLPRDIVALQNDC
jgi:hypothetical protein